MDSPQTEAYTFIHEGANFAGAVVHPVRVMLASGSARPDSFPDRLVTLAPVSAHRDDCRSSLRTAARPSFPTSQIVGRQAIVPFCQPPSLHLLASIFLPYGPPAAWFQPRQ